MIELVKPQFKGHIHHEVLGRLYEDTAGRIYIGSTTVLNPLVHSSLQKWKDNYGVDAIKKKVRKALELLENGDREKPVSMLVEILANDNPAEIKKREAAERGKIGHSIAEADLKGEKVIVPPGFEKFHQDWLKFKADHHLEPVAIEEAFFSERFGYSGRVDYLGRFHSCGDSKCCRSAVSGMCVIDYKTGRWNSKVPMQLASYKWGMMEGRKEIINHCIALMINGESAPKPLIMEHDQGSMGHFVSMLDAYKGLYWKELNEMNWPYLQKSAVKEWYGITEEL